MGRPKLLVWFPSTYALERDYAIGVVLREFLGVAYERIHDGGVVPGANGVTLLRPATASDGKWLRVTDGFFQTPESKWLKPASLPKRPLMCWRLPAPLREARVTSADIPVLYGTPVDGSCLYRETPEGIELGLDVFGSAFFMLTRYEESVITERDEHGRFPAHASLAYQEGFLERPLVDEYVEILRSCMLRLWPQLPLKRHAYRVVPTHDVDHPSAVRTGLARLIRGIGGDLLKRKDVGLAARRIGGALIPPLQDLLDPFNTFDWIMDVSERRGLKSAFYFMAEPGDPRLDGGYSLTAPWIRRLLRRVHERGHEIGLHGTYHSSHKPGQLKQEWEQLQRILDGEHIHQERWGGRQHYLRWEAGVTWRNWADAGLSYDSTLAYAQWGGFRCGTCREYPVFDLRRREGLGLRERPLIVMEASLLDHDYMALPASAALDYFGKLARACRRVGGEFVVLWHNSRLSTKSQRQLYCEALEVALH